jgi:tetratricopeptide (TPR) repeat protein
VYQREGEDEKALRLYRKALPDAWRRAPETYLMAAECYRAAGQVAQGLDELAPIAREHPETTALHLAVAMLQTSSGRAEEAEATLRRILERQPADLRAMASLLPLLEARGQVDEAIPLIRRALRLNPDSAAHHEWLGQIAESRDQLDQAAVHYARANQASPEWLDPLLGLGRVAVRTGRLAAAIEMFRGTVERFPRAPGAPYHLAGALELSGDLEGARDAYLEAERRGMRGAELFRRLGALAARRGDPDDARAYYERAAEGDPDRQGTRREARAPGGRENP